MELRQLEAWPWPMRDHLAGEYHLALAATCVPVIWFASGLTMLLVGGMQGISRDLYESAGVEGATWCPATFRYVSSASHRSPGAWRQGRAAAVNSGGEPLHPPVDGDVTNVDAAFGQQFLDVAVGKSVA